MSSAFRLCAFWLFAFAGTAFAQEGPITLDPYRLYDIPRSIESMCVKAHLAHRCSPPRMRDVEWVQKHVDRSVSVECIVGVRERGGGHWDAPIGCVDDYQKTIYLDFGTNSWPRERTQELRERCYDARQYYLFQNTPEFNSRLWAKGADQNDRHVNDQCRAQVSGELKLTPSRSGLHFPQLQNVQIQFLQDWTVRVPTEPTKDAPGSSWGRR